jgi:predicted TIM-barrel fold metal-dependent hydrolase
LLAFNTANAAAGKAGGYFDLPAEAALEPQLARVQVGPAKDELIFDVQGHFIDTPKGNPKGADVFIKDVFMDSDTDVMVLSFVPSAREAEPVTIQAADAVRRIVEKLEGTHRLLLHGRVNPNQPGDLEGMDELKEKWGVSAWKTYTQYGPGGVGYFLSDEIGIRFIERARKLGVKNICVHKGLPFGQQSYAHSQCSDIGVVAKRFPDVNFLIYHSGFVTRVREQPYDAAAGRDGVDTLISSLAKNQVSPGSNVYAELGSTWRFLMRDPEQAAHALGKLILHCGENNVLWGTDSIWYGSPQDQIQAFRAFQISPELRERFGYPEITPSLRAKIFGLNAAKVYGLSAAEVKKYTGRDVIFREKQAYQERPEPSFLTYGPKTRREFLNLLAREHR